MSEWNLNGCFLSLAIGYALSVLSAWIWLYSLWKAHLRRRPISEEDRTFKLLMGLWLVLVVSIYTVCPILWLAFY